MFMDGHLAEKSRQGQTRTRDLYDASEAFWVALDFSGVRAHAPRQRRWAGPLR